MPNFLQRRSVRLQAFDYRTDGAYFVTMVSHDRACIFSDIEDERVQPTDLGRLIEREWLRTAELRPTVELDEFVVMPNHMHAVIWLGSEETDAHKTGAFQKPQRGSLSTVVGLFKSEVTKAAKTKLGVERVWQRGFYEHVVRTEKSLAQIRQYIVDNPAAWAEDEENPANRRP